jgi:hypothetical protein
VLEDVGGIDLVLTSSPGNIGKRSAGLIRAGGTLVSVVEPIEVRPDDGFAIDFVGASDRAQLSEFVQRIRDGRLRTNIGTVSPLDDAVAAFNPTQSLNGKTLLPRGPLVVTSGLAHRQAPRGVAALLRKPTAWEYDGGGPVSASRGGSASSTRKRLARAESTHVSCRSTRYRKQAACAYAVLAIALLDWRHLPYRMIMQSPSKPLSSPIEVPDIDTDQPVAVIPVASVAPLDGPPDGERINTFAIAPTTSDLSPADLRSEARKRVLGKPLTYLAAAFSLGFVLARVLR